MRKREAKVGMAVNHHPSGKPLGRITALRSNYVRLDGPHQIASYREIVRAP